jgi:hypothetical protein
MQESCLFTLFFQSRHQLKDRSLTTTPLSLTTSLGFLASGLSSCFSSKGVTASRLRPERRAGLSCSLESVEASRVGLPVAYGNTGALRVICTHSLREKTSSEDNQSIAFQALRTI